jgi:pimeloyl-ACP methyl ester carboxylesterase
LVVVGAARHGDTTLARARRGIPGAELIELPHCGHSPHIQDPKAFWQAIKGFLRLAG